MPRQDIIVNIAENDDLYFENLNNPFFHEATWEADENGYAVLAIQLSALGSNVLDPESESGIQVDEFTQVPQLLEAEKNFLIYFFHIDGFGVRTESPKYFALDSKWRNITPFDVQKIDLVGQNIVFDSEAISSYGGNNGAFIVTTYEEGDFLIDTSIDQNEKMLLIANKGNMLNDSIKGVEMVKELNGNLDRDKLGNKIRLEWELDELSLDSITFNSDGSLEIKSSELFEE